MTAPDIDPRQWAWARCADEMRELIEELEHQGVIPPDGDVPSLVEYMARPGATAERAEAIARIERLARVLYP